MQLPNGYTMQTTFFEDFKIAEAFGIKAITDTYKRAFKEWKGNYVYLTELVIVLNLGIWRWYEKDRLYAQVYQDLWEQADAYACEHLKGDEAKFFYKVTD